MRTVLFVCTGNTCRSPMAEGIARHLQQTGQLPPELFFASAGTSAFEGEPMSDETAAILARLGVSTDGTSKSLTATMIHKADLVLAMTHSHVGRARALVGADSGDAAKVKLLDPNGDIADPIGHGPAAYEEVCTRMRRLIPERLEEMLTP